MSWCEARRLQSRVGYHVHELKEDEDIRRSVLDDSFDNYMKDARAETVAKLDSSPFGAAAKLREVARGRHERDLTTLDDLEEQHASFVAAAEDKVDPAILDVLAPNNCALGCATLGWWHMLLEM